MNKDLICRHSYSVQTVSVLLVGRIVDSQIYPLDGLEGVGTIGSRTVPSISRQRRPAARSHNPPALQRAHGVVSAGDAVRAVACLRWSPKIRPEFLSQAETALGFRSRSSLDGKEEAQPHLRGVAHTLPDHLWQLVVDIGGSSTEFIIGKTSEPLMLESLYMGCIKDSVCDIFPTAQSIGMV